MPANLTTFLGLSAPLWQALGLTLKLAAITTLILGLIGLPLATGSILHAVGSRRWSKPWSHYR